MTKNKLLDTITMMLGGRTAEEIMLKDITTGASNDIERATKAARKMVAEWGMSENIGLVSFGDGGEIFVGRDYQKQVPYSENLAKEIDVEIKSIIDTAHKKAYEILSKRKDVIEKVRDILLNKETIYKEEFEMLYAGASVEEVEFEIDKKEEEKRAIQEKAKQEAIEERKNRDIKQRVETAVALEKAGVITKEDLENIKKETEREFNEFKEKIEKEKSIKADAEIDNGDESDKK